MQQSLRCPPPWSRSLATNFWWQPASVAGLPRGMRCDAWAAPQSVITNAPAPAFNTTPPTLSWMYPRDCHPDWRTGNGECRVATRLSELYPQLSWNMWTARCYTYWSSSFADGQTRAANLGGTAYQHLAGRQVRSNQGLRSARLPCVCCCAMAVAGRLFEEPWPLRQAWKGF